MPQSDILTTDITVETGVPKHSSGQTLWMVAAVTFGLGLAASGYLNYVQFSRAQDEKLALSGQITDLRYQMKQDKAAPSPTGSPSPTPTPAPSITPAVLGATVVKFAELGVAVSASDPVSDLTYGFTQKTDGAAVANLTTTKLSTQYAACKPGLSALGQIVRRFKSSRVKPPFGSVPLKSFGDYNYYYNKGTGNCATDAAGRASVIAARAAVQDAALPTLDQIK